MRGCLKGHIRGYVRGCVTSGNVPPHIRCDAFKWQTKDVLEANEDGGMWSMWRWRIDQEGVLI